MLADLVIALVLGLAFFYGWQKGLISSVVNVLAILVSLVAAIKLSQVASIYISDWFNWDSVYLPLVSMLVVFVACLLGFRLLAAALEGILKATGLGFTNRTAGGVLWAAVAAVFLSVLGWYLNQMQLIPATFQADASLLPIMLDAAPNLIQSSSSVIPFLADAWDKLEIFFEEAGQKALEAQAS
jgi:membrane protein required for colicin V production